MPDQTDGEALLVACVCAAWCQACGEFRDTFDRLAKANAQARFVWLDLEGDGALLGGLDIDTFPTLAVFRGGTPLFYGATAPQEGVVARMLASLARADRAPIAVPAEIAGLPDALGAR